MINHILNKFDEGFEEKPSHHDMYRGKKSTYSDPVKYYIQEKGLKIGDYTIAVQLPSGEVVNFQDKIVIERKKDLNELCCNFFDKKDEEGKTRFERELERAKEQNIRPISVLVVLSHCLVLLSCRIVLVKFDRSSKVSPKAFNSILRALQAKYDISIEYCRKEDSARMIHDILYYHAREYLKTVE